MSCWLISLPRFLEYLPNGSIENLLVQHTRFLEPVAKHFTKQIALGLEYLHGVGIIHKVSDAPIDPLPLAYDRIFTGLEAGQRTGGIIRTV